MAYLIEVGQDSVEGLYLEFAIINANTGGLIDADEIDHQLLYYGCYTDDYGFYPSSSIPAGTLLASNENGFITSPQSGVFIINVPPINLPSWMRQRRNGSLKCRLLAVPSDASFTKILADVIIYYGEGSMASPRISLKVYPLYPVGFSASDLATVDGAFTATGASGTFTPAAGRGFNVSLWGTFVGTVDVERSFDGGTTWLPLTAGGVSTFTYTAPASEQFTESEFGVSYRLNCTAYTSGTINYRISQ